GTRRLDLSRRSLGVSHALRGIRREGARHAAVRGGQGLGDDPAGSGLGLSGPEVAARAVGRARRRGRRSVEVAVLMKSHPRIALIHATPIAMEPIRQAFESGWPEAEAVNLLEDSLSPDRAKSRDIPDELTERFVALTRYARLMGSDA